MDTSFWIRKWEKNEIAFHECEANPLLVKYFKELSLVKGSRVFLPLCGKTLDIHWLLSNGYCVAGAELSKIAIQQLFEELGVIPKIKGVGELDHYSTNNVDIFVGDIFDLSREMLGPVDAIYDRAALVALPEKMRNQYAVHLTNITDKAPQLLICYEYDQSVLEGPPFSVNHEEVNKIYGDSYDLKFMESTNVLDGLKGQCAAKENVWLLKKD
ncbi:thiopurine S-methyltransferase [Candidatus Methylospira mobilis]|uniref:thiopurine S-methyltransferase n=1 Tax=Candidatus Methylospira mobilis TaxID=1808979 RepID=UPI0028E932BB|nr:thiopurine S-methyltransferase [Candidatus Methylospira mobilis]WNV06261.1 thiopurine S-methyltransferase [Candidatus Methylospira mobilis]